jgi:ribonucleotide monophosphatase NagD (HAD superfamily)
MKYVIDIDGTICEGAYGKYENAIPNMKAIKKINDLYDEGHTIVYLTARGMGRTNDVAELAENLFRSLTEQQLKEWGCKYHKLTMGKPSADIYVDDRGINSGDFFK